MRIAPGSPFAVRWFSDPVRRTCSPTGRSPHYTSPALQARVEGLVVMDAVVLPDGSVGDVKIVRSLDRTFGLDEEAIKAVKQWRFRPGRRAGDPIAMLVSVEMVFELR